MSALEQQVISSMREHEILALNINQEFERDLSLGEHIADKVAQFGGSWYFIGTFVAIIVSWILMNSLLWVSFPFSSRGNEQHGLWWKI